MRFAIAYLPIISHRSIHTLNIEPWVGAVIIYHLDVKCHIRLIVDGHACSGLVIIRFTLTAEYHKVKASARIEGQINQGLVCGRILLIAYGIAYRVLAVLS